MSVARRTPTAHQHIPAAGPEREALRQRGQFWTPAWVAEAMVSYVLQAETDHLFDPAVGEGAFFRAAKVVARQMGRHVRLLGTEVDASAIEQASASGLTREDLAGVQMQSFVTHPPTRRLLAIVANPPYIRHHRLPATLKAELQEYGARLTGTRLDGRAGLHIYFLLRALELLDVGGRLAFIMPADTCEGKFAPVLWEWITTHYRLDAVVSFIPEATPFPSVDTNALIFMIQNAAPEPCMLWAQCAVAGTSQLKAWAASAFQNQPTSGVAVRSRGIAEALQTGLSRPPAAGRRSGPVLGDFVTVMRGIATGNNDFFFLTRQRARELCIPDAFLRRAVGRTRDVPEDEITDETISRLDSIGRPTQLLALDGRPIAGFPLEVQAYLRTGEELGLPTKPLISQRRPWYKMEARSAPPFLFAYLGRRNVRFIRNTAGVLPLTCFLCVYPRRNDAAFIERLWQVLRHPETVAGIALVAKSYGSGAMKVEPRKLEQLPLSEDVLREADIRHPGQVKQARLL